MPVNRTPKSIRIRYYATLREQRGVAEETIVTASTSPQKLYDELREYHDLELLPEALQVAVNDRFVSWSSSLQDGDTVVFIPPVSGG